MEDRKEIYKSLLLLPNLESMPAEDVILKYIGQRLEDYSQDELKDNVISKYIRQELAILQTFIYGLKSVKENLENNSQTE